MILVTIHFYYNAHHSSDIFYVFSRKVEKTDEENPNTAESNGECQDKKEDEAESILLTNGSS